MDDAGGGKEEGDLDRDEAEGERKHAARSARTSMPIDALVQRVVLESADGVDTGLDRRGVGRRSDRRAEAGGRVEALRDRGVKVAAALKLPRSQSRSR